MTNLDTNFQNKKLLINVEYDKNMHVVKSHFSWDK